MYIKVAPVKKKITEKRLSGMDMLGEWKNDTRYED